MGINKPSWMTTIIVVSALILYFIGMSVANAHNTGRHEAAPGGPCWIWEVPLNPVYCIFVHGTKKDHPLPDLPSSDV